MAFWASKYSLKGFCSAAPSSGTALPQPTQRERERGVGGGREGGREEKEGKREGRKKRERERGG